LKEKIAEIWLASQEGMSMEEYIRILKTFGSAKKSIKELSEFANGKDINKDNEPEFELWLKMRGKLKSSFNIVFKESIFEDFRCSYENRDIKAITIQDKEYPIRLRNIPSPPPVLFIKTKNFSSCMNRLNDQNYLAIGEVGSRQCSSYGIRAAEAFAAGLARAGVTVISGMALGIDGAAHRGALAAGGFTVAVLGSGILKPYPDSHRDLFEQICERGAVISEFAPSQEAIRYNFPKRNRIISGLSDGILVVEAGERSGSLITVEYAAEQGRDVFAIPGNINSYTSRGTNKLVKDGAIIAITPDDILAEYNERTIFDIGINSSDSCSFEFDNFKISEVKTEKKRIVGKNASKNDASENDAFENDASENDNSENDASENDNSEKYIWQNGENDISLTEESIKIFDLLKEKPLSIDEISDSLNFEIKTVISELVGLEMMGVIKNNFGIYEAVLF